MVDKKIIFFDGVCNLCNGFIDYVIKRDSHKKIYYTSLQSDYAIKMLKSHQINLDKDYTTIYYYTNGKLYSQSSAILNVFLELSAAHRFFAKVCLILPKFIRDGIYNFIAKNRYAFFGKKESCRLPSSEERSQFI